jgi:hypothetical protein
MQAVCTVRISVLIPQEQLVISSFSRDRETEQQQTDYYMDIRQNDVCALMINSQHQ